MVSLAVRGIGVDRTIADTTNMRCLTVHDTASQCQVQKEKKQYKQQLGLLLTLDYASQRQTHDHSHSMVAGGLLLTS
jgi:hypothetical protein